ncbi:EB module [Cooperia oncophora]
MLTFKIFPRQILLTSVICQTINLVNGYCIRYTGGPCRETQTMINGQCVTYSIVSGPCSADAQCIGGSTCQNSICQCPSGYTAMYGFCIRDPASAQCSSNEVSKFIWSLSIFLPCLLKARNSEHSLFGRPSDPHNSWVLL